MEQEDCLPQATLYLQQITLYSLVEVFDDLELFSNGGIGIFIVFWFLENFYSAFVSTHEMLTKKDFPISPLSNLFPHCGM